MIKDVIVPRNGSSSDKLREIVQFPIMAINPNTDNLSDGAVQ